MSQRSVNEVTEGILFSVILFTSCEFCSFSQMVLIKKERRQWRGGAELDQHLL